MLREKLKARFLKPLLLLAALLALSQTASAWNTYYLRPAGADYSASDAQRYQFSWQSGSNNYQIQDVTITRPTVYSILVCDNGNETSTDWAWFSASSDHNNVNPNVNQQYDITGLTRNGTKTFTLQPGVYTFYMTVEGNDQSGPTNLYIKKTAGVPFTNGATIYFKPNAQFKDQDPYFSAIFNDGTDVVLTNLSDGLYSFKVPKAGLTKVKIKRYKDGWSPNYTQELDAKSGYNCIEMNETVDNWSNASSKWVKFAPYVLRGSWADGTNATGQKTFENNSYSFGAGKYDPNYTFYLYDIAVGKALTGSAYYDDVTIKANGTANKLVATPGIGDKVTFTIKMVNGQPELSAKAVPVYYSYYIHYQVDPNNSNSSWSSQCSTTIEGGKSVTVTAKMLKNRQFGIQSTDGTWYGPKGGLAEVSFDKNNDWTEFDNQNSNFKWVGDDGDVEVTITLDKFGKVSGVKFAPVTPKVTYYLHYGPASAAGWSSTKAIQVPVGGSAGFTARMAPDYKFTISGDGKYYGSAADGVEFTDGVETTDIVTEDRNDYYWKGGTGPVTITVTLDKDGKLVKILANGPAVGVEIPDHKARPVYLLAQQLNGEEKSPEWQMEHIGEGVYVLRNFAMRPYESTQNGGADKASIPFIRLYDEDGVTYRDIKFDEDETFKASLPQKGVMGSTDTGGMSPGWAYNATFYFNGESLVMAPVSGETPDMKSSDILPFLGVLGENFKQATKYNTPITFYYEGNTNNQRMGNTSCGWQEAYIQYDANGNPVLDDNNKAYYNTYWPPRNNILMVSNVGDEVLPTSTRALTLKRDTRLLLGKDWKAELSDEYGDNYKNLNLDNPNSQYYVRYSVPNMWMLGTFKLWTGWAGTAVINDKKDWGAYWNGHFYFSAAKNNVTKVPYNTIIDAYHNEDGANYITDGKIYYRTLEVFIPVTVENNSVTAYTLNSSKIFATQSAGGATIDAKGDDSDKYASTYLHAGFNPSFSAWPEGYKLTHYTITRHLYDPNAEEGSYDPCDRKGIVHYNESGENEGEAIRSFGEIDSFDGSIASNTDFRNRFTFASSGNLKGYVDDQKYAPGMYIYSMEVEFKNAEGSTLKDVVWSPYVHLVEKDVTPTLATAQLIELDEANVEGQYGDYTHITFNTSFDGLLVKLDSDNKVLKAERMSTFMPDATTAQVRTRCAEIYDMYGRWTNKALLRTAIPASYTQQGGTRNNITTFGIFKDAACTQAVDGITDLHRTTPINGNYYRVYDKQHEFGEYKFYVKFDGQIVVNENGTDSYTDVSGKSEATYTTRFPLPGLGQANFDLITSENPMTVSMTHEAVNDQVTARTVANSLNFDIPIAMPRISLEGDLARYVYAQLHFELTRQYREEKDGALEGSLVVDAQGDAGKVDELFNYDSTDDTILRYDAQNPFDWMEVDPKHYVKGQDQYGKDIIVEIPDDKEVDPLMERVWKGVPRTWTIDNSDYRSVSCISPYNPRLFADNLEIELNCEFYTPKVEKAILMKAIAQVEEGRNAYVCRVYLRRIVWGDAKDASIAMTEEELADESTNLPSAFTDKATVNNPNIPITDENSNRPLYAVVARKDGVEYATSILTLSNSTTDDQLFLLWESPEFHWYAEMDSYDPGITLLVSRAYAFYAANDANGRERFTNFSGILQPQTENIAGSPLAIRYDQQDESIDVEIHDTPSNAPRRIMLRAEGIDDEGGETPTDPEIGDNSGAGPQAIQLANGDNAFMFVPRYGDATDAAQIQTAVDVIDAAEAGVEAGVGYIDVKGNYSMIFDAAGKLVYNGEGRVEVPAGVYVVNLHKGAVKVIVR